jgi:hypothetical protein
MKPTILRGVVALACITLLSACSGRSGAEDAVRRSLKDPDSAKFGTFYSNSKTGYACLTTNAKNSMGGYTGDKQVHLKHDKDGWTYMNDAEESESDCKELFADKP